MVRLCRKLRRRKGIRWEYNGDGMYVFERILKYDKRYWRRWMKRKLKAELREEIKNG